MSEGERRSAGAATYVGSRRGPEGRGVVFQEWRYRSTGRAIEVAEPNAYAPSDELEAGAVGFVDYERGIPVVVPRAGARLGRRVVDVRDRPSGPARRGARAKGSARERGGPPPGRPRWGRRPRTPPAWVWLAGLLLIVVLLSWGR